LLLARNLTVKADAAFAANLTDSLLAARNAASDAMRPFA
jgi:hypothetical protein